MKNIVSIIIMCCLLGFAQNVFGQLTSSTQYLYNPYIINPAAAGLHDGQQIYANYRVQWMNYPSAPRTAMLSYNGKFNRNGLGVTIENKQAGALEFNNIAGAYSYYIPLNEVSQLSIGLAARFQRFTLSVTNSDTDIDFADPVIADAIDGINTLDFSAGVFYQHSNGWYAGVSAPNLLETKLNGNADIDEDFSDFAAYYYGLVGYRMEKENYTIDPSILFRKQDAAPMQVEMNVKVSFLDDLLTVGSSYRTQSNILGFIFGLNIGNTVRIYYSYDTALNFGEMYSGGSNEFTLGYVFGHKQKPLNTEF